MIKNDLLKYFAEATDWSKRLTSVLPNGKFEQLGCLVKEIKSEYGLTNTFCWHALAGYAALELVLLCVLLPDVLMCTSAH